MNKKSKFMVALALAAVFLFYRVDSVIAMETDEIVDTEPSVEAEPEETTEPTGEPEEIVEPEETMEPTAEAEPEETTELTGEPEEIVEPEETTEPSVEAEPEAVMELLVEAELEAAMEPPIEAEPETVSTGEALMEWIESHQGVGGTVKLADHIVLNGACELVSGAAGGASILVDTGQYTITVSGQIGFLSNGRLTFSGQPDDKGIFYVEEKGSLFLYGIVVESDRCALWQEEGAGLEITDCSVSGSIHYADMPFVMYYQDNICAVVESGQTLRDVLPAQIKGVVNRQGQLSHDEWIPVSWDLEGTEKLQEERRRFSLQGSFVNAASEGPVLCTVAYNEYPLTIMDVKASVSGGRYSFVGHFTAPKEALPFTVLAEYSFDGENWLEFEEQSATDTNAIFYIVFKWNRRIASADDSIYIRLQWNDSGTRYFSNVLCYAADDLKNVEDIGGSRGGGTSIINPPDEPQTSVGGADTEKREPDQAGSSEETAAETAAPNLESLPADTAQAAGAEPQAANSAAQAVEKEPQAESVTGQSAGAEPREANAAKQAADAEPRDASAAEQIVGAEPRDASAAEQTVDAEPQNANAAGRTESTEQSLYAGAKPRKKESMDYGDFESAQKKEKTVLVVAAGFALLSAAAGTAGFCIYSRLGTNR